MPSQFPLSHQLYLAPSSRNSYVCIGARSPGYIRNRNRNVLSRVLWVLCPVIELATVISSTVFARHQVLAYLWNVELGQIIHIHMWRTHWGARVHDMKPCF